MDVLLILSVQAQVRECAKLANESVAAGLCVVIGLQSTGEANTNQTREEEGDVLDDFVSAPKRILSLFISKHFPTDSCDMESHELDLLQHQVTALKMPSRTLLGASRHLFVAASCVCSTIRSYCKVMGLSCSA